MNIAEIESKIEELVQQPYKPETFVFDFISIFDNIPKATITKLRQGSGNQSKVPGEVLWKKNIFFKPAAHGKAAEAVEALLVNPLTKAHAPRFVLSTDGDEFHCRDIKAGQSVDVQYSKLNDVFDFFLPLAGIERHEAVAENPADIKATARLANLYDAILAANPDWIEQDRTHELNIFMARLLFCFFAEGTSIFERGVFTKTVMSMTREDGSDTSELLQALFLAMDIPADERAGQLEYLRRFPYVNGGLFKDHTPVPQFSRRARRLLKECGDLSWREINPDIFGSMIQAVVEPGLRGDLGLHYTSVPNIMKALQPLFLMSLEEEFEAARDSEAKLLKLRDRLYNIRVFDPACGSGNFLIIAYRELRKIENRIFARLKEVAKQAPLAMSGIYLSQFYGIELADFAAETAKLSLWISEYQMNEQFKEIFGSAPPALPLQSGGNIIQGNSIRLEWAKVCPPQDNLSIYVVGNPPYLGGKLQNEQQKDDMKFALSNWNNYKNVDYVVAWFAKASEYVTKNGSFAFVTTNSINQGVQVPDIWPFIFNKGLEISFAHRNFKWSNNAVNSANVICSIVGVRSKSREPKYLFEGSSRRQVEYINAYLLPGDDTVVFKRTNSISDLPLMRQGNVALDDGQFLLNREQKEKLLKEAPEAQQLIKPVVGSYELLNGVERWCIWISDELKELAFGIPQVLERIKKVEQFRLSGGTSAVYSADRPHQFSLTARPKQNYLVVPSVCSERRKYLPVKFFDRETIVTHLAYVIFDPPTYVFSLISSTLHSLWMQTLTGRMKSDYRYSTGVVYNTFPVPKLSKEQQALMENAAYNVLQVRESFPGKTLAWLYDPDTMPVELLSAHQALDDALECIYIGRPFRNDTERLEHLFKRYSAMVKRLDLAKAE